MVEVVAFDYEHDDVLRTGHVARGRSILSHPTDPSRFAVYSVSKGPDTTPVRDPGLYPPLVYAEARLLPWWQTSLHRFVCVAVCVLVFTILVVAAGIGAWLIESTHPSHQNDDNPSAAVPGDTNATEVSFGAGESQKTSIPSPAPTPDLIPFFDALAPLVRYPQLLTMPGTPQNDAVRWLAMVDETDPLNSPLFHDDEGRGVGIAQRYALLVLHFALWGGKDDLIGGGGESNVFPSWVDPARHECDWGDVISCVSETNKVVEGLYMKDTGMTGELPQELEMLHHLETIKFTKNKIRGTLLDMVCSLSSLAVLEIGDNKLSGKLPSCIGRMKTLKILRVSKNTFGNAIPEDIYNLTNLNILDLSQNSFTGTISSSIQNLQLLTELNLADNNLYGSIPEIVNELSHLTFVHLDRNKITGRVPFFGGDYMYKKLVITLSGNHFSGVLPDTRILATRESERYRLSFLDVSNNNISGTIPLTMGYFPSLEHVDLSNNKLTGILPNVFANYLGLIHRLEYFDVGNNNLEGPLPQIGHESITTHIALNGNRFRGTIPSYLDHYIALEHLDLMSNRLSGIIPKSITNLKNLRYLNLENNYLKGPIPEDLGNLLNLNQLILSMNFLTGSIPASVVKLTNVERLSLHKNRLNRTIPSALGYLKNLKWLLLNDNKFTGEIPVGLSGLEELKEMFLQENDLWGAVPEGICKLHEGDGTLKNVYVDCNINCNCCTDWIYCGPAP